MNILQTGLEELANPTGISEGFAIIIIGIFAILAYLAMSLRSVILTLCWAFLALIFVIAISFEINFLYFWGMVVFSGTMAFISMGVSEVYNSNV